MKNKNKFNNYNGLYTYYIYIINYERNDLNRDNDEEH